MLITCMMRDPIHERPLGMPPNISTNGLRRPDSHVKLAVEDAMNDAEHVCGALLPIEAKLITTRPDSSALFCRSFH
jgi:hypothetical protein